MRFAGTVASAGSAPTCAICTLGQRAVGRACQPWRFVHLQSETVTETVAKEVPISALLNVVARDGVGIPARHAGANAVRRVFVRCADHVVDLALLRLRDAN